MSPIRDERDACEEIGRPLISADWSVCDDKSFCRYVEQVTYVLFLNIADERVRPPNNQSIPTPEVHLWSSMIKNEDNELFDHYSHTPVA